MKVVRQSADELFSLLTREISPSQAGTMKTELAQRILRELSSGARYARELAHKFGVHEQKIYYHLGKLERAGIIEIENVEKRGGVIIKNYRIVSPSFLIRFKELQPAARIEGGSLVPFIEEGICKCTVVVGSQDPHGPQMARSRDMQAAMLLTAHLGGYLDRVPDRFIMTDMEVPTIPSKHLILVGGPLVNRLTAELNRRLPVNFDGRKLRAKKVFEGSAVGLVSVFDHPDGEHKVLLVAGTSSPGTEAAIRGFILDGLPKKYSIYEGEDADFDGRIEKISCLEKH